MIAKYKRIVINVSRLLLLDHTHTPHFYGFSLYEFLINENIDMWRRKRRKFTRGFHS